VLLQNLFDDLPDSLPDEKLDELVRGDGFKLERIVSTGQATPEGRWYDQDFDEWVVLLTGSAALRFEDEVDELAMRPGDYVLIPAHRRHRLEWTDETKPTVWLALHYQPKHT
jgi:cupin 2 domain-containing protein